MPQSILPSVLIEYGTHVVLAVSKSAPGIVFLSECFDETVGIYGVQYPNYRESFFLDTTDPKEYPQWSWNLDKRIFEKTPIRLLTERIVQISRLATSKLEAVNAIASNVSRTRLRFATGVLLQETVYLEKRIEAISFRQSGYDETSLTEYPHVLLYADYAGISPKQAADDIIFKSKLDTELLAKTELLRVMYFNKIKAAKTIEEVSSLLDSFFRDPYVSALA